MRKEQNRYINLLFYVTFVQTKRNSVFPTASLKEKVLEAIEHKEQIFSAGLQIDMSF